MLLNFMNFTMVKTIFTLGKIGIELKFRDLHKISPFFSEKALRRLIQE